MNRIATATVCLALVQSCSQLPAKPSSFMPGQVWIEADGDQEVAVLVLGTHESNVYGPLVAVVVQGLWKHQEIGRRHGKAPSPMQVYPAAVLMSHVDRCDQSIPQGLFGVIDLQAWEERGSEVGHQIQVRSPLRLIDLVNDLAKEFGVQDAPLPAYLPGREAKEALQIYVGLPGELSFQVGRTRCGSMREVKEAVFRWMKEGEGRDTIYISGDFVGYGEGRDANRKLETLLNGNGIRFRRGRVPSKLRGESRPLVRPGQVWQVPAMCSAHTVTILHSREIEGIGEVIFVRFDGEKPLSSPLPMPTDWVPFWGRSLQWYLDVLGTDVEVPQPGIEVGKWIAGFDRGEADLHCLSPAEYLRLLSERRSVRSPDEIEDLILPKPSHVTPEDVFDPVLVIPDHDMSFKEVAEQMRKQREALDERRRIEKAKKAKSKR